MPPYVIINCAMSADGKIALPTRRQTRISNEEDLLRVYRLRNQSDAVLVGIGTVLADDPFLTVFVLFVGVLWGGGLGLGGLGVWGFGE